MNKQRRCSTAFDKRCAEMDARPSMDRGNAVTTMPLCSS